MKDDCCDAPMGFQPLKTIDDALATILAAIQPISDTEMVNPFDGMGRVLAEPLFSQVNQPPWDNSAMDGYALNTSDVNDIDTFEVSQRIPAGSSGSPLKPGTLARIFTGAPTPPGADAVVIQENTEIVDGKVKILKVPEPGANIRLTGEDTKQGSDILQAGIKLAPQHLGLAASVGIAEIPVKRKLKVAIFSSGDELVMPGNELHAGQIYNSNQFTLNALLQGLGCEVINLGMVEDTFEATCDALQNGAEQADLVLASGGVSVGEEDHVKPAVEHLGSLDLWKIAVRPGKPLAFGHIGNTPFLGAPGNPVSLFVTFCLFARPVILKMQGITSNLIPGKIKAKANFDWNRPDKRREFARGRIYTNDQGETLIDNFPSRSSGVLTSLAWANGLIEIPEDTCFQKGDLIDFIPYSELLS